MRKYYMLLLVLTPFCLSAQETQGVIIYEETRQMQFNFGGDMDNEELKSMLPSTRSSFKQLLFTNDESIYLKYENLEKESANEMNFTTASGGVVAIKMKEPNNEFYRNISKGKTIELIEFMSKNFIIEEPAQKFQWKVTGETKELLDYQVMKATLEDTAGVIEAWFAPQIPVSIGPEEYGELPGLILEITSADGSKTLTATKIDLGEVDTNKIVAPRKGKKVSREEFEKIQADKRKEMEEMYGGKGGNRVIIDHK